MSWDSRQGYNFIGGIMKSVDEFTSYLHQRLIVLRDLMQE